MAQAVRTVRYETPLYRLGGRGRFEVGHNHHRASMDTLRRDRAGLQLVAQRV